MYMITGADAMDDISYNYYCVVFIPKQLQSRSHFRIVHTCIYIIILVKSSTMHYYIHDKIKVQGVNTTTRNQE